MYAFYAQVTKTDFSKKNCSDMVLKRFKKKGSGVHGLANYLLRGETQIVAMFFAEAFNKAMRGCRQSNIQLKFMRENVWQVFKGGSAHDFDVYTGQDKLPTEAFTKWNDNGGNYNMDDPHTEIMQAFSYFTYHMGRKFWKGATILVCDLQGIKVSKGDKLKFHLTDPVIHFGGSKDMGEMGRFGATDLGYMGIQHFLKTYKNNKYARKLGLPDLDDDA